MSDLAKRLHDEELGLWNDVRSMHETLVNEKRDFSVDEQQKFDNLHSRIDTLDKRKRELIADETRMAEAGAQYSDFNSRAEVHSYNSVEKRANEEIRKVWRKESDGFDIPVADSKLVRRLQYGRPMTPVEARVLYDNYLPGAGANPGSFTNPSGAGIVPIDFYDQLISYLVEVSGIMQVGPTVLNTKGGEPIQMPVVTQHTGQVTGTNQYANLSAAQGGVLQPSDPQFSSKLLSANKFGILVQVPRELLDDSGVNLLGYLATSAGRSLGNVVGNALINSVNGSIGGVSNGLLSAPVGITGQTSLSGGALSGQGVVDGGPRYQDLVNLQYSIIAPYRQSRSCYWLAADQSLGKLRLLTDTVGRPLWEPSMVLGTPDLLLGKPIVADPFIPQIAPGATSIAFGDFSQYVIRLVGDMRFERSDDFAFNQDLVSFRSVIRVDGQLLNPAVAVGRAQPIVTFQGGAG